MDEYANILLFSLVKMLRIFHLQLASLPRFFSLMASPESCIAKRKFFMSNRWTPEGSALKNSSLLICSDCVTTEKNAFVQENLREEEFHDDVSHAVMLCSFNVYEKY